MKYQFIEEYKQEFPIVTMCGVLEVSESGFYAWRTRPACRRKREDAQLTQEIRQVFEAHQGRYGAPRIHKDLHDEGITCSRKRVERRDARGGAVSQSETASGENEEKRRNASGGSQHFKSRFSSGRAEQEMGGGHYIYTNNAGMVVCSSYFGCILPNGGRVVDVKQLR